LAVIWTEPTEEERMHHHATTKERNRDIYQRAGREARRAGSPLEACPKLQRGPRDTYGAWLEEQWRKGWFQQDDQLRQLPLL
jgi:hypothetical protein